LGVELGYAEVNLKLAEGDLIILTSDGVVEANDLTGQEIFGFDRLEKAVGDGPITSAPAMLAHLQSELAAFTQGAEQNDDVTIVVIRV
jgi:sigma-B regulation protein RsbU (phosphoserine phosphatase)